MLFKLHYLFCRMDSYVLAETFKYLYLLFSEKEDLILNVDDYVFTTEAHLLPLFLSIHSSTRNRTEVGTIGVNPWGLRVAICPDFGVDESWGLSFQTRLTPLVGTSSLINYRVIPFHWHSGFHVPATLH